MADISVFVNWILVFVFLCTGAACCLRLTLAIFGALAFPTYLGLFYAEMFIRMVIPQASKLKLRIPKTSFWKKLVMNVCASCFTVSSLGYVIAYFQTNLFQGTQEEIVFKLLHVQVVPFGFALLTLIGLVVIFVISYRERKEDEDEDDNPLSKIEKLEFPELLKTVFGL